MDLPKQTNTIYHTQLPSDKRKRISYHPWRVREQKAMLTAQVSEDPKVIFSTVKKVVQSCLETPLDVEKMNVFDFEHLFIKLREVSVGEFSRLRFWCQNPDCADNPNAKVEMDIDIREVKTESKPGHEKLIPLFGDVSIQMKYMTVEKLDLLDEPENEIEGLFDMVVACVDCVYEGDTKYDAADFTPEQLREFVTSLRPEQFQKIEKFFDTCPRPSMTVEYGCPVCSKKSKTVLTGLKSFF